MTHDAPILNFSCKLILNIKNAQKGIASWKKGNDVSLIFYELTLNLLETAVKFHKWVLNSDFITPHVHYKKL